MTESNLPRRRYLGAATAALTAVMASGCSLFSGPPSIRVSRDRLQQRLAGMFPKDQRLLELLDVHMEVPMVDFVAGRLALNLPAQVSERFTGETLDGSLSFTTVPRWDERDNSIRLSQVKASDISLKNASGATPTWLQRIGGAVAERMLNELVVYRLTPEQISQLQRAGLRPTGVKVGRDTMELVLVSNDE